MLPMSIICYTFSDALIKNNPKTPHCRSCGNNGINALMYIHYIIFIIMIINAIIYKKSSAKGFYNLQIIIFSIIINENLCSAVFTANTSMALVQCLRCLFATPVMAPLATCTHNEAKKMADGPSKPFSAVTLLSSSHEVHCEHSVLGSPYSMSTSLCLCLL